MCFICPPVPLDSKKCSSRPSNTEGVMLFLREKKYTQVITNIYINSLSSLSGRIPPTCRGNLLPNKVQYLTAKPSTGSRVPDCFEDFQLTIHVPSTRQAVRTRKNQMNKPLRNTQRRFPPQYNENTFQAIQSNLILYVDRQKCILRCAIKFVPVRSKQGNFSLLEITRARVLFSRKFQMQFDLLRK